MSEDAFLIVPLEAFEPDEDFESLDRLARLKRIELRMEEKLGRKIRARLPGFEVEFKLGGWIVRSTHGIDHSELASMLADLPVSVAPDQSFYAV